MQNVDAIQESKSLLKRHVIEVIGVQLEWLLPSSINARMKASLRGREAHMVDDATLLPSTSSSLNHVFILMILTYPQYLDLS